MDKIAELCAAEQKYIDKLQLVCQTYGQLMDEAADPEVASYVRLDSFPALLNQHQAIFKYYENMWEVHSDLFAFWTHSVEDYLDVDRCGQLFYHGLIEQRFDVYLDHIVGNPLRHSTVQEDLTGFIEHAMDNEDMLLLTGYECFRFPLDHLHFYGRAFAELADAGKSSPIVLNVSSLLQKLLRRMEQCSKFSEMNCEVFLPSLGTYLESAEFVVRDYKEGQQHKAELFLFKHGILLAKQKGRTFFKRDSELEYDSYYAFDQIELSSQCFRLKDATSKLTVYKVIEKRRETKSMIEFLEQITRIKKTLEMRIFCVSTDLSCDLGDREVINLEVLKRQSTNGLLLQHKLDHTVRVSAHGQVSFVEAFNTKLCNDMVLRRIRKNSVDKAPGFHLSIRDTWRRAAWKAVNYIVAYL